MPRFYCETPRTSPASCSWRCAGGSRRRRADQSRWGRHGLQSCRLRRPMGPSRQLLPHGRAGRPRPASAPPLPACAAQQCPASQQPGGRAGRKRAGTGRRYMVWRCWPHARTCLCADASTCSRASNSFTYMQAGWTSTIHVGPASDAGHALHTRGAPLTPTHTHTRMQTRLRRVCKPAQPINLPTPLRMAHRVDALGGIIRTRRAGLVGVHLVVAPRVSSSTQAHWL